MYKPLKPIHAFLGVCAGIGFLLIFVAAAAAQPANEPFGKAFYLTYGAFWLFLILMLPIRVGLRNILPNRVLSFRGATWVLPRLGSAELILLVLAGASVAAFGVIHGHLFGWPSTASDGYDGVQWTGPLLIAMGMSPTLTYVWRMLRGLKLTPESLTYWRGFGRITLAWDEIGDVQSTNDVRDHEGYRKYLHRYQPGAKVVVPPGRVSGVLLRVRWEDYYTPRLLLETEYFTVEPSALLTAILALRDRPELRPLLGTRAAKALFVGPPWRVRRHLYRTQQWWPKGAAPERIAVDRDGVVLESR